MGGIMLVTSTLLDPVKVRMEYVTKCSILVSMQ